MQVKQYGTAPEAKKRYSPAVCLGTERTIIHGKPDPAHISTSYMVALYALWYNCIRIHKTLRVSPAMESGVAAHLFSFDDLVGIVDEWETSQRDTA